MDKQFYLDGLSVGQKFRSHEHEMTADGIKSFARQFDPQPFHIDETAAQSTFFGELVASGWHTAAVTMKLMVESIPIAGGLIGAGTENLKWHLPVRPGDRLTVETEVLAIRDSMSKPNKGLVRVRHMTFNQHSECVQEFVSTIIVPKSPSDG